MLQPHWTKLEDTQCGFRPGHSTTDQILEKSRKPKMFARILWTSRKRMTGSSWKALVSAARIQCWSRRLLSAKSMLSCSQVCVKSQPFTVRVGLWQGCVLSLLVFIVSLYMKWIGSHIRVDEGDTVASCKINRLFFVDDSVLFAPFEQGLQHALRRFSVACDQVAMKINTEGLRICVFPEFQASVHCNQAAIHCTATKQQYIDPQPGGQSSNCLPRNFLKGMYLLGTATSYIILPPPRKYHLVTALHCNKYIGLVFTSDGS